MDHRDNTLLVIVRIAAGPHRHLVISTVMYQDRTQGNLPFVQILYQTHSLSTFKLASTGLQSGGGRSSQSRKKRSDRAMGEGYLNVASKGNANLEKSERKRERIFKLLTTRIKKSCRLRWRERL